MQPTTNPGRFSSSIGPCYVKLLVSNVVAGSIIGTKGASIAAINSESGATIRLSHANSFFPGTSERVVALWGTLDQVKKAFQLVLEKVRDAPPSAESAQSQLANKTGETSPDKVISKIVVPNSAVSQIIGKQGQAIQELQESTKTKIQISNREGQYSKERVVVVTGPYENVCNASLAIAESIQGDAHLKDNTEINYMLPGSGPMQGQPNLPNGFYPNNPNNIMSPSNMPMNVPHHATAAAAAAGNDMMRSMMQMNSPSGFFPPFGTPMGFHGNEMPSPNYYQQPTARMQPAQVITGHVDIPDSLIGFAIGKHGGTLNAIQTRSGAKMQVSSKGEFVSGTENRRVTISGSPSAVQMAEAMLQQKLREIQEFQTTKGASPVRVGGGAMHPMSLNGAGTGGHQQFRSSLQPVGQFSQF